MTQAESVLQIAQPSAIKEKLSFADYLKIYNSVEGMRTEWTPDGVESYLMSNNVQHQDILQFLVILLSLFLKSKALGRLLVAGIPMYISADQPAREPDLLIVLNEHRQRIKATYLDGRADVVVEIVSPESDARDHGAKLIEYEAAGIPEYWLIDPARREMDIYAFGDDKRYHRTARDAQGWIVSLLLTGFALDPALLWLDTLSDTVDPLALIQQMGT